MSISHCKHPDKRVAKSAGISGVQRSAFSQDKRIGTKERKFSVLSGAEETGNPRGGSLINPRKHGTVASFSAWQA